MNWLGSDRSTYHTTCVHRVNAYLKRSCTIADFERKLVDNRITDALGIIEKGIFKTWFLCEIKVNYSDLQKAPNQIHDTAFRFKQRHKGDTVVPVIAFPARLQKELVDFDNWNSFRDICKRLDVSIWVVEQSTVREFQGYTTTKAKSTATKPIMAKVVKAKSTTAKPAKAKVAKTKSAAAKTTTKKTTTTKTKPKKTAARKGASKK
ncbi:hypothetical protein ACFLUO_04140 [Chloroflexota bacterium]